MSEELALAPRHLSGTQKSAILMLLLGEDEAADLLKHMGPREVQNLGQAMYSVADVDQDTVNVVLDEFILAAREQTSLGLGTGPYVKNVFVKALGEEKAGSVLGRMSSSSPQKGIEILDWMDARSIAATISSEHPQVIAAVLCHLEPATLDSIQPDALAELERVMQKQIKTNAAVRSATAGGTTTAARIMNYVRGGADRRIIEQLTTMNENIGQSIQDQMFVFENLLALDDRSMQTLLRSIDNTLLVAALKGSDERMRAKMFAAMSQRAAQSVQDEIESRGPMKVSEVQDAQKRILAIARQLGESGAIMLGGSGDDYV